MRRSFLLCLIFLLFGCSATKEVSSPQNEVVFNYDRWIAEGKEYGVPYFIDNPVAKDCTYGELMVFLEKDRTDQMIRPENDYLNSCERYTLTLHDNAEKEGIRCGFAVVTFVEIDDEYGRFGHAVDVFSTTDQGIVYIDDTKSDKDVVPSGRCSCHYSFDKIGDVVVGEKYIPKRLFNNDESYKPMGTVESVDVYWGEING